MDFKEFYVFNNQGKSNCVIRTFCKIFNEEYNDIENDLCLIAKRIGCASFNDIIVFETYMKKRNVNAITYGKNVKIKDLNLDEGRYIIFCWDKKDYYHMVPIIDGVLFDKNDKSLELYVITIYK